MDRSQLPTYICPMHHEIRESGPGICTRCGMNLIPEDARFPMLQHLLHNPMMAAVMVVVTILLMMAALKLI
jgi:hypothetical protein